MKNHVYLMPLRQLLTLLVGLLVLVALLLAASDLRHSRQAYRDAVLLSERNNEADFCLQAVRHFAFERGRSAVVLNSQILISHDNHRFISERRAAADRYIGDVLAQTEGEFQERADTVRMAWDQVKKLRSVLDQDFVRSSGERNPALPAQWLMAANALLAGLEELMMAVSVVPGGLDANFARLASLRTFALQFRNVAGAESSAFASVLSAKQVPGRSVVARTNQLRGRLTQLWLQLEPGTEALGDPRSAALLGEVRSALFGRLRPLQDEILRAADNDRQVQVSPDHYLSVSFIALNSAADLADSISQVATDHTNKQMEIARQRQFYSLMSIAAVLCLAAFVAWLLVRRFTRPLNEIVSRINALLSAQTGAVPVALPMADADEFVKVQQALELLDEATRGRLASEQALVEKEQLSASILAATPHSIIATEINGLIKVFSPGAEVMLGYSAEEMVGKQTPLLIHDPDEIRRRANELSRETGCAVEPDFSVITYGNDTGARIEEREWTYVCKDGKRLTVLLAVTYLRDAQGAISGCLGVATDITGRKAIENTLLHSAKEQAKQNNLLNALLETIPVGIFMVEAPSGRPLIVNDAARFLLGRGLLDDVNKNTLGETYAAYRMPARVPYPVDEMPIVQAMNGQGSHVEDMMIVQPDGTEVILEVMGSPVRDSEGQVWASVVSFMDITGRFQSAAEMSRLAYYDPLTRLPNRRLFHDRMQMAITKARRDKSLLAVLLIDLDKFKPVNDNLGHPVGDLLLKAVADRMHHCLRESDTLARIGGDEFVVLLPGIDEAQDALGVAEKIRLELNEPFFLTGGFKVSIACCIGVAIYPEHGKDEKRLLKCADDAMYAAKENGRNRVQLYDGVGSKSGGVRPDLSVVRLVWHRDYRCGEPAIDQEHHELFDQANELIHASLSEPDEPELLRTALDDLVASLVSHFQSEEAILEQFHYADVEDHQLKHQRLIGQALELRSLQDAGELTTGDLVSFLAHEVVVKHMLVEDKKYYPLFAQAMKSERPGQRSFLSEQ